MLPWAVRELATGGIAGSTSYYDIAAPIDRVEIGYTWYGALAAQPQEHQLDLAGGLGENPSNTSACDGA